MSISKRAKNIALTTFYTACLLAFPGPDADAPGMQTPIKPATRLEKVVSAEAISPPGVVYDRINPDDIYKRIIHSMQKPKRAPEQYLNEGI